MEETKIKLSALWVSLMLTYLLGDVFGHGGLNGYSDSYGFPVLDIEI